MFFTNSRREALFCDICLPVACRTGRGGRDQGPFHSILDLSSVDEPLADSDAAPGLGYVRPRLQLWLPVFQGGPSISFGTIKSFSGAYLAAISRNSTPSSA